MCHLKANPVRHQLRSRVNEVDEEDRTADAVTAESSASVIPPHELRGKRRRRRTRLVQTVCRWRDLGSTECHRLQAQDRPEHIVVFTSQRQWSNRKPLAEAQASGRSGPEKQFLFFSVSVHDHRRKRNILHRVLENTQQVRDFPPGRQVMRVRKAQEP